MFVYQGIITMKKIKDIVSGPVAPSEVKLSSKAESSAFEAGYAVASQRGESIVSSLTGADFQKFKAYMGKSIEKFKTFKKWARKHFIVQNPEATDLQDGAFRTALCELRAALELPPNKKMVRNTPKSGKDKDGSENETGSEKLTEKRFRLEVKSLLVRAKVDLGLDRIFLAKIISEVIEEVK
jgi:hypothetical protein